MRATAESISDAMEQRLHPIDERATLGNQLVDRDLGRMRTPPDLALGARGLGGPLEVGLGVASRRLPRPVCDKFADALGMVARRAPITLVSVAVLWGLVGVHAPGCSTPHATARRRSKTGEVRAVNERCRIAGRCRAVALTSPAITNRSCRSRRSWRRRRAWRPARARRRRGGARRGGSHPRSPTYRSRARGHRAPWP